MLAIRDGEVEQRDEAPGIPPIVAALELARFLVVANRGDEVAVPEREAREVLEWHDALRMFRVILREQLARALEEWRCALELTGVHVRGADVRHRECVDEVVALPVRLEDGGGALER